MCTTTTKEMCTTITTTTTTTTEEDLKTTEGMCTTTKGICTPTKEDCLILHTLRAQFSLFTQLSHVLIVLFQFLDNELTSCHVKIDIISSYHDILS